MRNVFSPQYKMWVRLAGLCLLACVLGGAASAKEYVRWVDENGVIHIEESLPPEEKDRESETLNDQGVVTGKVPRAPTEEELAEQRKKAERDAARAALTKRQAEYRDNLFRSYATIGDLRSYHKSRMEALYYRQSVNDHKVRELRDELRSLMDKAREFNFPYSSESSLPPMPSDLLLDLQVANQALSERQEDAETLRRKLIEQERRFESDLEIYQEFASPDALRQTRAGASGQR